MDVRETVEYIRLLPGAFVDCSIRQGRDKILRQLSERIGKKDEEVFFVDAFIEDIHTTIATLIEEAAPYDIPNDYLYFLEFYGGLAIDADDYRFSIFGVGPMVEEEYASIVSDVASSGPKKYGFLPLGLLSFRQGKYKYQRVNFFLDLAGNVQKYSVLGIGPWGAIEPPWNFVGPTPSTILGDINKYSDKWQKLADSFTKWLAQIVETQGMCRYL